MFPCMLIANCYVFLQHEISYWHTRFIHVIEHAYEQTGQRVVILVDEYDKLC